MRIERFKRLPQRSEDEWQGGLVRLPSWIEGGPHGKPYRPWAGFWVSRETGLVHLKIEKEFGAHDWPLALDALVEFGLNRQLTGYRPGGIRVMDQELSDRLRAALGETNLEFTVAPDLPVVRQVLTTMSEQIAGEPLPPNALDAVGMTVDRMRRFAEAAQCFYQAAPWRHLSDEDLIEVEAPQAERGLSHLTVLGGAGYTFGLGFFESLADLTETVEGADAEANPARFLARPRWSLVYGPISDLPFGDADLWEQHGLPVAADNAYPVAMQFTAQGKHRRPDARLLSYFEGLLRAVAETTEDEIDDGRWTRQVETYDGPAAYQLCIPALLEPPDAPPAGRPALQDRRAMERVLLEMERLMAGSEFGDIDEANRALSRRFRSPMDAISSTASTPLEKAQEIAYRAFESRGRRRIQLARRALASSADCADAYVVLAENSRDVTQAVDLYAQGVAAGERALGAQMLVERAGSFWGLVTTRPYMRARFGLAQCLEELGRSDEAIGHYRELLRLNPTDNQGVRYSLLKVLFASELDQEAIALLEQFPDDPTAMWLYGRALSAFRRQEGSLDARARLRRALGANRHVPKYLTGKKRLPSDDPTSFALASEEEAVICARALASAWQATPRAVDWLRNEVAAKKSRKGR